MEKKEIPTLVLFKKVRMGVKRGLFLKINRRQKEEKKLIECKICGFKAKTKFGLLAHKRFKHDREKINESKHIVSDIQSDRDIGKVDSPQSG